MKSERIHLPELPQCIGCGQDAGNGHVDDCAQVQHEAMLAGDKTAARNHDPEACYSCLLQETVENICRCAQCCHLLIEATLEDAIVEPRIKEVGSPIVSPPDSTASGQREIEGFLLNREDNDYACGFLDRSTNLCTIHATRPLVCRLFDCEGAGREQMRELGYSTDDR